MRSEARLLAAEPHRAVWTLVLTSIGLFMGALDNMVVTTALPVLRTSLNASLGDLEWTVNAYILSFACFLLTGAALGDRFGRRRMFCIGVSVFAAASATCALAPSVGVLIGARAVQGAGAAMLVPLTLTLISEAFPAEKRGMAVGIWGGIAGLAVAGGPVVGGAVVQGLNWHWIFWLNVPVGLVVVPLSAVLLRESFGPSPRLDLVGLVLASAGFLGIVWGLIRGNSLGWSSAEVLGSMVAGAGLVALFLKWEAVARTPMLTLALLRRATIATANGASFFMNAGVFGALFLMAQFFQTAQGYSPLRTGIQLLPWTATAMLSAPLAGKLSDRYGNRPFMASGLFLQAVGLAWVASTASADVGYAALIAPLTVAGIGIGLVYPTVSNEIIGSSTMAEVGVANGMNSAVRELGGVFGIAILAALFAARGSYSSPQTFVTGFTAALWLGAALSVVGGLLATPAVRRALAAKTSSAPHVESAVVVAGK